MYQKSYEEIAINAPLNLRKIEREAIIRSINYLQAGLEIGPDSVETAKACAVMQNLWTILIADVMNDDNKLPLALRANIISIGMWIQRELSEIGEGRSANFSGVIDVMFMIADGLA